MRQPLELDKNINNISLWEREQTQTLHFFLVQKFLCVGSHSLTPPLECLPQIKGRKLSSLTYSWLVFNWRLHLIASWRSLTSACRVRSRTINFYSHRACAQAFELPFLSHFQHYYSATWPALSIYLFIHFIYFLSYCAHLNTAQRYSITNVSFQNNISLIYQFYWIVTQ